MRISDWSSDVCSSDLQGCSSDAARIMGGIAPYEAQIPHLARSSRGSNWRCFTLFFHGCASSRLYRSPPYTLYVMLPCSIGGSPHPAPMIWKKVANIQGPLNAIRSIRIHEEFTVSGRGNVQAR